MGVTITESGCLKPEVGWMVGRVPGEGVGLVAEVEFSLLKVVRGGLGFFEALFR